MEADLARFYPNDDLRDLWRRDDDGRRVLTLRRLRVLIRHLPEESALALAQRDGKPHWSVEAHLIDDLRMSMTGTKDRPAQRHPARPKPSPKTHTPERQRRIAAARRRAADRRRRIESGELR